MNYFILRNGSFNLAFKYTLSKLHTKKLIHEMYSGLQRN